MIYLNPTVTSPFQVSAIVLPRVTDITTSDSLTITSDSSGSVIPSVFLASNYDSNNILTIIFSINSSDPLKEGNFYTLKLNRNVTDELLWSGIAFASSQDKVDYTINKDEFKEKTSNNDYIILD